MSSTIYRNPSPLLPTPTPWPRNLSAATSSEMDHSPSSSPPPPCCLHNYGSPSSTPTTLQQGELPTHDAAAKKRKRRRELVLRSGGGTRRKLNFSDSPPPHPQSQSLHPQQQPDCLPPPGKGLLNWILKVDRLIREELQRAKHNPPWAKKRKAQRDTRISVLMSMR